MANTKVTGDVIANGTISTVHIADDAITAAKLDSTATGITFADLAVNGDVTIGNNASIKSIGSIRIDIDEDNDSTGRAFLVRNDGGTNTLFKIQENGNVGIGTISPGYKLDVTNVGADAINVNASNDFTGIRWSSDQHTYSWRVGSDNFFIYDVVNSAQRVTLNASGNVGIGVTSPGAKLDVAGSGKFQPGIAGGDALVTIAQTNSNAYVHAGLKINAGNTNPFYIYQSGSSNTLRFNYNSLSDAGGQMVITDGGNVGIGTASPGNTLDVAGDTDITGQLVVSHDANYVAKFVNTATSMSNDNYALMVNSSSHTSNMTAAGAMSVDVNSGRAFTINGIGRVSIGGNTQSANTLTLTGSATELDIENTSGRRYRFNCDASGNLKFEDKTGGTEVMRFASNNNVGVGATSPTNGKLEVQQTATTAALWVQTGGTTDSYTIASFRTGTNAPALEIKGNGAVGIGTSPQYAKLQVNDSIRIDDDAAGAGSDTHLSAPNLYLGSTQGGATFQYNASYGLDLWQYSTGGSWNQTVKFTRDGDVFVKGRITGDTNNGNNDVSYLRTITIPHGGSSSFTFDINPVAEFGTRVSGGRLKLEASGWGQRLTAGYIVYRNDGSGSGKIGTGDVVYYRYAWSESSPSSTVAIISVSLPSSSTNVIRISFSGWHSNDHGFEARLTATS